MEPARLVELRLTDFKSFHNEVLPFGDLTVLIGGNATGKSNALDALFVLSRLASGLHIQEALDGSRIAPSPIRGGSDGCAPLGKTAFKLGCRLQCGGELLDLDFEVKTAPQLEITNEVLSDARTGKQLTTLGSGSPRAFLAAALIVDIKLSGSGNPHLAGILEQIKQLGSACRSIFPLDPDPRVMRGYVPSQDNDLQTDAANLSAAVEAIRADDPDAFGRLEKLAASMSNGRITKLDLAGTEFGEVQLVLEEWGTRVPARLASDGTLRFLAFVTALLSAPKIDDAPDAERLIMIEEVERGLYPAQARLLVDLMRKERERRAASILLTTHSPALLASLDSDQHRDVVVCSRDPQTGRSRLKRLTELPGYLELMAAGDLGAAIMTGKLTAAHEERTGTSLRFAEFLESL